MINVYSDIIQFKGNHYQFGYRQGELLRNSPILIHRNLQKGSRWRNFLVDIDEVRDAFQTFSPALWEEIEGLADALKMPIKDAIREFGGYYYEYGRSGCSIYTEADILVRNYDNAPRSYEGRYVIYNPTDGGYATVGPTMQITGRTDGINEKGFAMGYNFVNRVKSDDGFVCNMIGRLLLENCASVEEAKHLIKELPHRHTFSYVLLDKNGYSVVAEVSPRNVRFREANMCTNHFEELTEENRYRTDESMERLDKISSQQTSVQNPYEAYQLLNNLEKGIFSKKYGAWAGTLHTAAYLPKDLKAWIALGANRPPLIFDFQKWLDGQPFHATKIKGVLDTDEQFVNV
ncbi:MULTISPECIES: C45 family peptidase [Oceanobacillus]|uniref:Linear amide C-N hydrolase n=1 Tax=Oceanobacillus kimchii TaxID=746691 RepID=A0ABQ5THI5_9BACI|nr:MULTISPECIES: C45 family peptidase [Oceanobacillus]MBT2599251.1 linear amide C-N hydrolase [Oceanobacillus sp. ISL-74]MBT2652169.1 linear amide C-N hydrolase [Oceanobacillus sp. ISL-73]MCT1578549.1 C45 family autoproteolytic acyltransferase/hydrolase [Oceanobacillus kimchii]MCT2136402.1 C45 family autoproteolytic acyltransferase/hydrolase [Oceanobacillus kimchii]OEH54190.1 choloylglycine hydrolase [Oceanobacillus sp. E9]